MMAGNTPNSLLLESKLAKFCQKLAAFLSSYGYLVVLNSITSVIDRGDTVVIDQLSHASIVDAAFLSQNKSGKRVRPFKHNDMNDLEPQLKIIRKENEGVGCLIVTEGVFGMHGNLANLPEIVQLKNKYKRLPNAG